MIQYKYILRNVYVIHPSFIKEAYECTKIKCIFSAVKVCIENKCKLVLSINVNDNKVVCI